jgi:hypothetical protein
MDASVPTTNHRVILRQKDNGTLLGIEFKKKIPCCWAASAEYILFNCLGLCLAYRNKIWHAECTVNNKLGYDSLPSCYDRYLCPGIKMN